eukprot:COSAG02_NODE_4090_length_5801_cov_22.812347_3_plen_61_part_00
MIDVNVMDRLGQDSIHRRGQNQSSGRLSPLICEENQCLGGGPRSVLHLSVSSIYVLHKTP